MTFKPMSEDELERLLWYLRRHTFTARLNEWERQFAAGIALRARNRNWRPTRRQAAIMRQIVGDALAEPEDVEVIEQ